MALSLCCTCVAWAWQAPVPQAAPGVKTPSALIRPSLDGLGATLDGLHPEKWKAPGAVRQETAANIDSIRRDLATTLPPLLTTADTAPDSAARILPAYRNIDALYDVLLRVSETGRLSAPDQQAMMLEKALVDLENGRRALGDRLQATAAAHDRQVQELQVALRAKPAPSALTPAVCPPPTRTTKRRVRSKTTTHKTTPAGASQSQTPSH